MKINQTNIKMIPICKYEKVGIAYKLEIYGALKGFMKIFDFNLGKFLKKEKIK